MRCIGASTMGEGKKNVSVKDAAAGTKKTGEAAVIDKGTEKERKLSYDELQEICLQLNSKLEELYKRYQEANLTNFFNRLEFLFKVLENSLRFDDEFIDKVVGEIQAAIYPKEIEPAKDGEKEDAELSK